MTLSAGTYRHYKGNLYKVFFVATHSETEEPHVVYQALYGERGHWIRPYSMFTEMVEMDGATVRRFELADPLENV